MIPLTADALATRDQQLATLRLKKRQNAALRRSRYEGIQRLVNENPRLRVVEEAYATHFQKEAAVEAAQRTALKTLLAYLKEQQETNAAVANKKHLLDNDIRQVTNIYNLIL
jgi:hypothetical protein